MLKCACLVICGCDVELNSSLNINIHLYIFNTGICVTVELLLSKGADVNSLSCRGTPLHVAAMENHGAIMKILLDYNADVRFMTCTTAHFLFSRADTVTLVINYT